MTPRVRLVEHAVGLTWIAPEPAFMQRASHAIVADGRVWVIDPVDLPGVDEAICARGRPAAVIQLLDRHPRDCASLASRLGVSHLRLPTVIEDSPFVAISAIDVPRWREVALWWPERRVLVVAEAVGTVPYYRAPGEPLAVHPFLRLTRPLRLRGLQPEHLLVGHGEGMHGPHVAAALDEALRTALRRIPAYAGGLLRLGRGVSR